MAEQLQVEEEKQPMKASKELFEKRIKMMDQTEKTDFTIEDKFGYLCDDGVLIECDVLRLHSKGKKVFVALGEHHAHLTENHSIWFDVPNERICSMDTLKKVRVQIARQKSASSIKPELQSLVGDDAESGAILNELTKQPSLVNMIEEQEKNTLLTLEYVFKSIDLEKNQITCLDDEYHDVVFDLDASNKELLDKINKVIEEGKNEKKDVKVTVSQLNDTETVSNAFIAK